MEENIDTEEGRPPAAGEGEDAPPSAGEAAPPPPGDVAPPPPREEAPPPSADEAPPPPGEEAQGQEDGPVSPEGTAPLVGHYRDLIPSEERIVLPDDDDEQDLSRLRPRLGPRPVQSVLSSVFSSQSSRRSSKYRRSMSGIPNLQETLKEKQARFREARESRKLKIDPLYKYMFEILAEKLGLDVVTVEELILDCPSLEAFARFFGKDGSKTLKFLYQEGDVPGVECGRTIPGVARGAKMMRLYIDNAAPEKLKGLCIFFVRCRNDVTINVKNIHEEILFTVLDASEGLLNGIRKMLANIFLPAILATNNWGALNQSKQGESEKHIFTETINRYLSFLDGARVSIEGTVKLKEIDNVDFSKLHTFEEVTAAASNSETVHQLEEVLMIWYKQIEQVLIESEQMRKEADDSGPLTELEHWKRMSAKFNYIIEQIKGSSCKAVINVLNVAHSKLLKTMVPSLDDIQQAINRMIQLTLEVSRGVAHWGQQQIRHIKPVASPTRTDVTHPGMGKQLKKEEKSFEEIIPARKLKNFYPGVAEHKDISKLVLLLSSSVNSLRKVAHEALQDFQKYKTLWTEDRDVKVKGFLANNPSLTEIRSEILHYATFEQEIDELKPIILVGALELHTEPMKLALSIEAKAWKMLLCRYLNEEYKKKMSDMIAFINEYLKKLSRPIRDLDDVRFAMEALSCIRDNEIQMDMTLGPIEEAYAILNRFEVEVTKEESEAVDTLRYSFNKLQSKADICISAIKEKDIEAKLTQVVENWTNQNLSFAAFKGKGELLLKGTESGEIITLMEDSLMILGSLLSNRYNAPFKKTIQNWVYKLSTSSDIIEEWLVVQNLWVYLEAVFVGGDIAKQLPQEAKRFQNIDKSWIKIMQRAHENPNVISCCVGDETMGQLLPHLHEQLEVCQKSLTGYLEKKRLLFPRFFFVSDPVLLEILGQASDSHTIQPHLPAISDNINEVTFHAKDYDRILAVISREGEKIPVMCYITLAQALGMNMGGAPAGPAGTGKTETTKDMGRCLGKYVVVFNCSDQMDFRGLGRIFKGKCENIFLILDGPVDAIWIENLNSVLDDNKTLTLANGDRIPMAPNCKLLFEVHNIENASPATVSRMGMVYISSSALSWKPILQAWLKKRTAQEATVFLSLYEKAFEDTYTYMKLNLVPKMQLLECNYIVQAKMLPTPSKFHYIFNLRDLSRIWQGMLTVKAEECSSISVLLSLFKHECNRVIADRFITPEDEQWFNAHLIRAIEENISSEAALQILPEPYFVDFLRDMPEPTEDLKFLYKVAGADGKGITFIFTDNEIKDEAFLEYLNNLLSSGEISNLFARDEMDEITQGLISVMKKELPRHPPTFDNLYEYFISRSRKNLHVVLCFSPVGEKFRARSLKFPGLISGCTMDWFSRWPKEALIAVASYFLSGYNIVCSSEIKRQVVETMGLFHDMVSESCESYFQRYRRRAHVTPKSYLSFINGYKNIYTEKVKYINEQAERMNIGLDKLMEASESVAKLSQDLAVKEKELAVASVKADEVLAEVTVSAQASAKVKNEVQEVKDKAQKIVDEIDSEKVIAETKLEAAKPALEEAEAALNANLAKQEGRLAVANAELGKAQALLDEKQAELDKVQAKFDAAMNEKMDLLNDADMCRKKMQAASTLIDGLSGEKVRWTQQSKEFKAQISRLVGDILLCTGFLSYLGPFNQIFRNYLLKDQWEIELRARRIPFTENLNLISMLVDPPTIGEWGLQGLPGDDLSIQNGIIVTKATRYPLLIDPQTQGKTWIKSKEKENDLQVTSLNHKYFRTHLEDSLSLGRPLLIEDIREELDPALDNVLEKNFIKSGTTYKVKVGDKECDIMDSFKLYITTKLPNPAFTPEINAKTSVIDFTVTMKGLENQLLRRVILTEKQELESERVKLLEDVTFNKRKMKELEDNLLYKLSATKGSLVDDESLIGVLRITKQTAAEVSEKLHVAAETEIKINTAQEEFRPAATRGSILYFLITEMSMVNIMYQTSLAQFLKLFDQSMARSEKSPLPQKRITNIIEYLTYEVFTYSVRGLYENHKFLFVLLMTLKIDLQRGTVKHREFQALIKGGAALDLKACPPKPFRWILDMTWLNLVELSKLPQFAEIMNQISRNEKGWKNWFDRDAPEEEIIPDGYNDSLDTCRKLLLIRSWCPDRTVFQARKYIADSLEEKYTEPVILNLEKTWEESDSRTPLICFLSMGSDPTIQIDALAKKLKLECRTISMGQGQEVHARKLIQMSMQQERRKFGPLGWNIPYEFNSADFSASVQFIQNHLDECDIKKVWFSEKMFEPTFCFYTGYKIPLCKTLDQYFEYIQSLPSLDNPEVFGLHPNADITYQSNTASAVLETITNIQPKESGGGVGETREAIVYRLSEDMLSKLPPDYIPHEVKARLIKMGHLNSMNIFLRQEIDRMQKVITILRSSLSDLKLAIEGTIIMSENLRDALDNMYDARIPQIWKRVSWDSSTLGFWFTELLERNAQFSTWIFEGRPNVFWMTGFFNPQGFLTAMRQEVTRAHKGWALDTVTIHNEVLRQTKEEITSPPGEGVYIYGLYMDGAAWDRRNGKLTESTPKVLFTQLPVLHIFAINSTAPKDPKLYVCPIYKKPRRTDLTFITVVYLRTVLSPDHWILRGVALLCDIKVSYSIGI
ncbi:Dynein heavy chain 8, axonemal [Tupaia chinensis]|uniref:Dynein heavy chain 8, axonemal n=1 Tax=Tupaia chinensis TaxID=246437 RepID=L9KT49_TUPCH|nr:Dynein heavy chain 8, axonemal [Tupaia chinensis]